MEVFFTDFAYFAHPCSIKFIFIFNPPLPSKKLPEKSVILNINLVWPYGKTSGKTERTAHGIYRPGKGVR